jgi:hypothetical protein
MFDTFKISNNSSISKTFTYEPSPGTFQNIVVPGFGNVIIDSYSYPSFVNPGGVSENNFLNNFTPGNGQVWLWWDGFKVKHININNTSLEGNSITPFISQTKVASFILSETKNYLDQFLYPLDSSTPRIENFQLFNSTLKNNYSYLFVNQLSPNTSFAVDALEDSTFVPAYFNNSISVIPDCDPTYNNVSNYILNRRIQVVDYSIDLLNPINFDLILRDEAEKSPVPESNYTQTSFTRIRYNGSRSSSQRINVYTSGSDEGTFGSTPNVESRKAYFTYYSRIYDLYPLLNFKTTFEIKYIIDSFGNIQQPRIGDASYFNFIGSLTEQENALIAVNDKESEVLYPLNGLHSIFKSGEKPVPILYSQTSSNGFSNTIELSIPEPTVLEEGNEPNDYSFDARLRGSRTQTTSSFNSGQDYANLIPNIVIKPTNATSSYNSSTGIITFPTDDDKGIQGSGTGKFLSDNYDFTIEHNFETSIILPNAPSSFDLIELDSFNFLQGFSSYNQSSIDLAEGEYNIRFLKNDLKTGITDFEVIITFIDNNNNNIGSFLYDELSSLGSSNNIVYNTNDEEIKLLIKYSRIDFIAFQNNINYDSFTIGKLKFTIKAKALPYTSNNPNNPNFYLQGDTIRAQTKYYFFSTLQPANVFFPTNKNSEEFIEFTLQGTRTSLFLQAGPNYWEFIPDTITGEINTSEIELVDDVLNLVYDKNYFQKDLPYTSSLNPNFPGGLEPSFVKFPLIRNNWNLKLGDEIRFENKESKVYRIVKIIVGNNDNNLKLILDKPIPPDTNLNFFLVRRYINDNGTLIINYPKPYENPPKDLSSAGFAFPEFIIKEISTDPDKTLRDLIDKKVIE